MEKQVKLVQLIVLNTVAALFLVLAAAAGWLVMRGAEPDLVQWMPIVAATNTLVISGVGVGANKGPWPRRVLMALVYAVMVTILWVATVFVIRQLFNWPSIYLPFVGQTASFVGTLIIAVKQLSDGYSAEERDRQIVGLRQDLDELKGKLYDGQAGGKGRSRKQRRPRRN